MAAAARRSLEGAPRHRARPQRAGGPTRGGPMHAEETPPRASCIRASSGSLQVVSPACTTCTLGASCGAVQAARNCKPIAHRKENCKQEGGSSGAKQAGAELADLVPTHHEAQADSLVISNVGHVCRHPYT
eukprot:352122-Chlamydomonas_euryale.AAC.9